MKGRPISAVRARSNQLAYMDFNHAMRRAETSSKRCFQMAWLKQPFVQIAAPGNLGSMRSLAVFRSSDCIGRTKQLQAIPNPVAAFDLLYMQRKTTPVEIHQKKLPPQETDILGIQLRAS